MANLNSRSLRTGQSDDLVYAVSSDGLTEGKTVISDYISNPNWTSLSATATLARGSKNILSGTDTFSLPDGVINGEVIIVMRDDATNSSAIAADGSQTIEGDATLSLDVDRTAFRLIYKLSTTDWEVFHG